MLIELDFSSQKPIYEQLYEQIILSIAKGTLKEGDPLPSVRVLAAEIGINLHTVNKTYNLLKDEGYVQIDRRKGALVSKIPISPKQEEKNYLYEQLEILSAKAHLMGITEDDFVISSKKYFEMYKGD